MPTISCPQTQQTRERIGLETWKDIIFSEPPSAARDRPQTLSLSPNRRPLRAGAPGRSGAGPYAHPTIRAMPYPSSARPRRPGRRPGPVKGHFYPYALIWIHGHHVGHQTADLPQETVIIFGILWDIDKRLYHGSSVLLFS